MSSQVYPPYPSSPLDWFLMRLGTAEMRSIFNEKSFIEKILKVEAALAEAEGELGVIPRAAAREIVSKASIENLDLTKVKDRVEKTGGHYLVAIIEPWRDKIGEVGEYVHWGATTQDISDTAMVLLVKDANELILKDLEEIQKALMAMARQYKDTPMAGRSHAVHALPMTFGLKVAVWLDEVTRHVERFEEIEKRLYVGNMTGAVGTFASFGEKGPDVQRLTMARLGLGVPGICWHAARDRFAEYLNLLAVAASTLSKIATQVLLLMRTEIAEIEEPIPPGHVGSSTMPQKRNPFMSEFSIALARVIRGYAHTMAESMETYDERGFNTWFSEFIIIPESCLLMSTVASYLKTILQKLVVHPETMKKNLNLSDGLINSEAIMMALAKKIGRQNAHHILYDCAEKVLHEKKSFRQVLLEHEIVTKHLSKQEIEKLIDPTLYLGSSSSIVDEVVKRAGNNTRKVKV